MSKNWLVAHIVNELYQAELAKKALGDHGISSVIINRIDSAYQQGYVEILVERDSLIKAKNILKDFLSEESDLT